MSVLRLSCGHYSDRLFIPISGQGWEKWKTFKKKFGKVFCKKFKELGIEFRNEYFCLPENPSLGEREICPQCYSEWRDNT